MNNIFKWYPYNKGGEFRKWYGNNDYVVNFQNMGEEICQYIDNHSSVNHKGRVINRDKYFKPSGTWSLVSSGMPAFRYKPNGFIFDIAGMSFFSNDYLKYLIGLCNSKCILSILEIIAPTLNYQCGDIANIPVIISKKGIVEDYVDDNIRISCVDWDSFEISWDFSVHPLILIEQQIKDDPSNVLVDTILSGRIKTN